MMQISKHSLFLLAFICLLSGASPLSAETRTLVIEGVEDGDTLLARLNGRPERLQLAGIDAPEDTDNAKLKRDIKVTGLDARTLLALGRDATAHLRSLVQKGDRLSISGNLGQRDRYGRIPVVAADQAGRSINEAMVKDGYAVVTRFDSIAPELKARLETLESKAIADQRGLWGKSRGAAMAWSGRRH